MTSLPAFDPNSFATGIDRKSWSDLNTDPLRPLQNRAIQGRYSPGSTFKILTMAGALADGRTGTIYACIAENSVAFAADGETITLEPGQAVLRTGSAAGTK